CQDHKVEQAKQVVILGSPKLEICNYARDRNCDLLILGSHGRHGIKLLLGSTANGVLHDMPCDVLAVKLK
ncbi:MAG: universal stress protein, partial [Gammaproteobacteria bacterium]|nr:universal stress protein [Gammaproteobacteria bacterium]